MPYLSQDQQNTAAASDKSVQERLAIIRDGLDANPSLQEKLPGLKSILDEYLDPDNKFGTDTHRHGFHRRLLQVFRDSEVDDAYGHRLSELRPDEQDRIKRFVAGSPVEKAGKEFAFGPSLGVREHIEKLVTSKPVYVEGLNSKEDVEVTGLLSRLLSLLPNWLPHGLISSPRRSPKNPDPVMVSSILHAAADLRMKVGDANRLPSRCMKTHRFRTGVCWSSTRRHIRAFRQQLAVFSES